MASPVERFHALDLLRATAMFLGILLHGVLSFINTPVRFWPVRDVEHSLAADLFVLVVHAFRMQVFFLLAGFFGCLLYQRHGWRGLIRHRLLRLVVPFGLAVLFIEPTLQAAWLIGDPEARASLGLPTSPSLDMTEYFLSGQFFLHIVPAHLWFLYYLIVFFAAMAPLIAVGYYLSETAVARLGDRLFRLLIGWRIALAGLTVPALLPMQYAGFVDTPQGWSLQWQIVGYYFFFFAIGWMLWRHRDRLSAFASHWKISLLFGNLVVLPLMIWTIVLGLPRSADTPPLPDIPGRVFFAYYFSALYTWLMVSGLIGAFQHGFHRERAWGRYLADSSYWCYLWHLTPIVFLQLALAPLALPGLVKLAIIIGGTLVILLASYEWGVRYTFIGAILNGRKTRSPRAANVAISRASAQLASSTEHHH